MSKLTRMEAPQKLRIMNNRFDELTVKRIHSVTPYLALRKCGPFCATLALIFLLNVTGANCSTLGPLTELSRPNAVGTCDDHFVTLPETSISLNDAFESFMAVNPVDRKNIVVVWTQGLLQNVIAAVTLNGGRTWQQVPVPFTVCSGGPFLGAGDTRICFAPNGDTYVIAVAANVLSSRGIAV